MNDFKFECPHCKQHLQCNEAMSGRQIQCPTCHHLIVIPPSPAQLARGDYSAESGKTWQTFVHPVPQKGALKVQEPPPPPAQSSPSS